MKRPDSLNTSFDALKSSDILFNYTYICMFHGTAHVPCSLPSIPGVNLLICRRHIFPHAAPMGLHCCSWFDMLLNAFPVVTHRSWYMVPVLWFSPLLQVQEWHIQPFLAWLVLLGDLVVIVDDGKGVDKVGAQEGIDGLWQKFACTRSVLGPVSKVTNQFACGCCTDIKGKKEVWLKKTMLKVKVSYSPIWMQKWRETAGRVFHVLITWYSHLTSLAWSEIIKVLTNDNTNSCLHDESCVPSESLPSCGQCEHGRGTDLHHSGTHASRVTDSHTSDLKILKCLTVGVQLRAITPEINTKLIVTLTGKVWTLVIKP